MKRLIIILFVFCFQQMAFGQGWVKILNDTIRPVAATNAYDGGYLIAGAMGRSPFYGVMKIDSKGNKKWIKNFTDFTYSFDLNEFQINISKTIDSAFLLNGSNTDNDFIIKKLSQQGNIIWSKKLPLAFGKLKPFRNEYILIGKSKTLSTQVILRLNLNGDTISEKPIQGGRLKSFDIQNDGIFAIDSSLSKVLKFSFDGQIIWQNSISLNFISGISARLIKAKDSSYYFGNNDTLLYKISKTGTVLWKKSGSNYEYATTIDGGVIGLKSQFEQNGGISQSFLQIEKINANGISLWKRQLRPDPKVQEQAIISCTNGGYLIIANAYSTAGFPIPVLIKIDENGEIYSNFLEGKVIKDLNKNCQINATDKPFKDCIIEAKNTNGDTFWGLTDSLGQYSINIDSGSYTLKAYPRNSRNLWQSCTPSVSKTFSSIKKTDTLDFLLSPIIDCPALETHITTPFLRRCFNNTYAVSYCNKGTTQADNAYMTVTLDSLLEFVSASKSINSQVGRTYRFNLGNIAVDDCGRFDITTRVRCGDSTRLNQALCVEARIFPDTICTPNTLWSGANMVVTGTCQQDSVLFQIRNTGTAPSSSLNSIVIEDEVLFLRQPVQLPRNGVFSKKFPANGRTWRMVVEQEPNHPTSTNPTAFVEGCRANNNLPFNTGFVNLFPNDDKALAVDVDCHPIQGAYDPNDKTGYPLGYKSEHFVAQNQDIEYIIRFQNTGTDTAFNIVVRDTISEKLDISSIEFGSSSHIYEPEIYGKGILKFTFNNIQLVDSFKNEAKSHGFVQYRIKQQKDLAFGTKIYNSAGIYFDFNEPILTNKTLHTVGGKDIISATIEKNYALNFSIKISPNPFTETAVFETPLSIKADFELLDITGKVLRKEKFEGTTFEFHRNGLAVGIYLFKISVDGRPLSIGKLVIQ